ncbi:MAG: hypothetical protein NVS9B15_07740 [Acidobacteriaceae bacterium]
MSFGEMFFLVFLALIVFGPKRLPEMARKLGKIMGEFRRASNEFKAQIEEEVRKLEIDEATKSIGIDLKQTSNSISRAPLDQQILPPTTTQDLVDHSFETATDSTHEVADAPPATDEVSGQHV